MKIKILSDEIEIKKTKNEIKNNSDILFHYDILNEKNGIIFGKNILSGDRLDYWANHIYYIAIRKKDKKILGTFKKVYGWYIKETYQNNKSITDKKVNEWKKEIEKNIIPKYPFLKGYKIETMKKNNDDFYIFNNYLGCYENESIFTGKARIKINIIECKADSHKEKLSFYDILLTTIIHELGHAIQDYKGLKYDEKQAESFADFYWDFGKVLEIN